MWIVRLALTHPFTFVVMAVLIAIFGGVAIVNTPVDIFPYIDIPVISVVWTYQGLSPEEMEKRVVTIFERSLTTTVNDIEHIESQSYSGAAVIRVYLHPTAKVEQAQAQITSLSQSQLRQLPPESSRPISSSTTLPACPSFNSGSAARRSASSKSSITGRTSFGSSGHPRSSGSLAVWGQEPAGDGRPEPGCPLREPTLRYRRFKRTESSESHPPCRHRENRREGISG